MSINLENQPHSGTRDWSEFGKHRGRILHREKLARNVHLYVVEKPDGFEFTPGQAVDLALDQEGWREEKRPFTITSVPSDPRLEFIIKSYPTDEYPNHDGMTEHLAKNASVGDRLIFSDAWGAIKYQGPGLFIAGGAGMTPFISILRYLHQQQQLDGNRVFFSNQCAEDIFLQGELFRMLGRSITCTLTEEQHRDYEFGEINTDWLRARVETFDQPFYICGPPHMVEDMEAILLDLGVTKEHIVHEAA
ncbi:FAD-binding oxidoreductase [Stieleria sp. JC731]|uniref:FAD-binding oxidoreductase n=1 Tax=Pirellulaceae TaxID=2691357 RepID=UPI001E563E6F|nr:FAD-binding oxidoreductase [Stieleria sp. JC731]MCC9602074.1 FAD-binding oxidoreductase [Stieleria sp. JC731]